MELTYGELSRELEREPRRFKTIYADLLDLNQCAGQRVRDSIDRRLTWLTIAGVVCYAAWKRSRLIHH